MFSVVSGSPLDDEWEERDRLIMFTIGRPAYYSGATCYEGLRQRDHEWHVDSLEEAQRVKTALESILKVTAFIRES